MIGGNLITKRYYYTTEPFNSSINHQVILTGNSSVSFANSGDHFNILTLTNPIENYTFSNNVTWNKLICDSIIEKQTHSITLGDNIGVNYYLKVAEGTSKPVMTAWLDNGDEVEVEGKIQNDGRYKFTFNVAAPETADIIHCKYSAIVDGKTVETSEFDYSVKQYCEFILKNAAFTDQEKAIAANLLNYAAYSQIQFNHNTDNLANANLDEMGYHIDLDSNAIDSNAISTIEDFDGEIKAEFTTTSIILNADTAIKYYMTLDEGVTDAYMAYRLKDSNSEYQYVPLTATGSRYYAVIDNVKAPDLTDYYETFICEKVGDNYNQISNTKYYSPECYANSMYSKGNENVKNVVVSMMMYCRAAREYFK